MDGKLLVVMMLSLLLAGCNLDQRYIYFPEKWRDEDWGKLWNLPIEDVWLRTQDGLRLHGWFVGAKDSKATMLWCHANAGNIINRLENISELHRRGLSVFIFDY